MVQRNFIGTRCGKSKKHQVPRYVSVPYRFYVQNGKWPTRGLVRIVEKKLEKKLPFPIPRMITIELHLRWRLIQK